MDSLCNRKTCKLSGESIPELGDGESSPAFQKRARDMAAVPDFAEATPNSFKTVRELQGYKKCHKCGTEWLGEIENCPNCADGEPSPPHPEDRCSICGHRFRNHHSGSRRCPTFDKMIVDGWLETKYRPAECSTLGTCDTAIHLRYLSHELRPSCKNWRESGAAQEVSPVGYVSEIRPRPADPSCHVCGAQMAVKEWKCRSCKATTGVEEVSPPSPELITKANDLLRRLNKEVFNDAVDMYRLPEAVGWVIDFAKENCGDTRELKAALEEARIKLLQHLTPSTMGHFRRGRPEDVDWYMEFAAKAKRLIGEGL